MPNTNNTNNMPQADAKTEQRKKILNIVGVVLCVILLPILLVNCILIVKGIANEDEVPGIGGYMPLIVLTQSMEPKIKAGDIIICKEIDAKDVKVEDVISFFDPEGNGTSVVTHRVYKIEIDEDGKYWFYTEGDNNDLEDRLAVPEENLVGIWTGARVGLIGHVVLFTQSTLGLIICIFVPIGALIAYEVIRRKKSDEAKQNDIDMLMEELKALKQQQANSNLPTQENSQTNEPATEETTPSNGDNTGSTSDGE